MALFQLQEVTIARNPDGTVLLDKYGCYRFVSAQEKDAAYALCYAYFGVHLWREWLRKGGAGYEPQGATVLMRQQL